MTAPTKINAGQFSILQGAADKIHVALKTPSKVGDTLVVWGMTGSGGANPISTIQDDKGNSLTVNKYQLGSQGAFISSAQQIGTGGSTKFTINLSSAQPFTQFGCACFNNLGSGAVVVGGNNPNGTSLTSATINTTGIGESFVLAVFFEDSGQAITQPTRFTATGGSALLASDGVDWETVAIYKKNVAASASVSLSVTSSNAFTSGVSAIVAFPVQAGAGEGPGTTAECGKTIRLNFNSSKANPWPGTTYTVDLPMEPDINCITIGYTDANIFHAGVPGNTSTSPSNTIADKVQAAIPGGVASIGYMGIEHASVSLTGSLTVTVTSAPATATNELQLFIEGWRNVKNFAAVASGTGTLNVNPPVTQNNVLSSALVTTEANQVIAFRTQEVQQSPTAIVATAGGTAVYTMPDSSNGGTGIYEGFDAQHDEGDAVLYVTAPSSVNFNTSYSPYEGALDVSGWAAVALSMTSTSPGGTLLLTGVG